MPFALSFSCLINYQLIPLHASSSYFFERFLFIIIILFPLLHVWRSSVEREFFFSHLEGEGVWGGRVGFSLYTLFLTCSYVQKRRVWFVCACVYMCVNVCLEWATSSFIATDFIYTRALCRSRWNSRFFFLASSVFFFDTCAREAQEKMNIHLRRFRI